MKEKILIISSVNPSEGPGTLALDCVNAFKEHGYDVDLLTKLPVKNHPEILHVLERNPPKINRLFYKLWRKITKPDSPVEHGFFYRNEKFAPVCINKVIKQIRRDYDVVITLFWQGLLSFATMDAIYDHLNHPQMVFLCVDYSPITGSCHFIGDCERFEKGCGKCPMIHSSRENDFTRKNVLFRKSFNRKVRPFYLGNTYMLGFFKKSLALQEGARLEFISMILDTENQFLPLDKIQSRKSLGLKPEDFVIFFGSQNISDKRKGFTYLLDAIDSFSKRLPKGQMSSIKLLVAGKTLDSIKERLPFEYKYVGYVGPEELPKLYSSADVFISPSVNDAGPSMVNQSIACGTPVISFDIGTAIDVIENYKTGFRVPVADSNAMACALLSLFNSSPEERNKISRQCRLKAIEMHSFPAFVKRVESILSEK